MSPKRSPAVEPCDRECNRPRGSRFRRMQQCLARRVEAARLPMFVKVGVSGRLPGRLERDRHSSSGDEQTAPSARETTLRGHAPAPGSRSDGRSGRFGGDVGKARRAKRLLLRALPRPQTTRELAQVSSVIFRRPSMAGGRRPLADTPLRHKHEGIEGERYGCGPRTTARGIADSPPNRPETPSLRGHEPLAP
jgi:hypothetical protein